MAVVLILTDTVRRMNSETRPIDWWLLVIEVLVLALIAAEFFKSVWRKHTIHKRQIAIRRLIARGQELLQETPKGSADTPTWAAAGNAVIEDAKTFLNRYSPEALTVFLDNADRRSVEWRGVHSSFRVPYEELNHRIKNLRSIMEKADVYF